jgi:hypothetical protein
VFRNTDDGEPSLGPQKRLRELEPSDPRDVVIKDGKERVRPHDAGIGRF